MVWLPGLRISRGSGQGALGDILHPFHPLEVGILRPECRVECPGGREHNAVRHRQPQLGAGRGSLERQVIRQDGLRMLSQYAQQSGDQAAAEKYMKQYYEEMGADAARLMELRKSPCFAIYQGRPKGEVRVTTTSTAPNPVTNGK